jgi:hypothetical protein
MSKNRELQTVCRKFLAIGWAGFRGTGFLVVRALGLPAGPRRVLYGLTTLAVTASAAYVLETPEQVANAGRPPIAPARRLYFVLVERAGYRSEAGYAIRPKLGNVVGKVLGPLRCSIPCGYCSDLLPRPWNEVMAGPAIPLAVACDLGRQGCLGPLTDQTGLKLSHSRHLRQQEAPCCPFDVGQVTEADLHSAVPEALKESLRSRQSIDLGDHQRGPVRSARSQRFRKLGAVGASSALCLREGLQRRPAASLGS